MANAKILEQKQLEVAAIKEKLSRAKSVVLVDYRGLKVSEDTALRREFRKAGVEYQVLKNKHVQRALSELKIQGLHDKLEGPTAVAFGYDDVVSPSKIIVAAMTSTRKMSIKGGIIEGSVTDAEVIRQLALIPDKTTLIAMLLGMLTAPVRSLAVALNEIAKKNS